jgi:transposase
VITATVLGELGDLARFQDPREPLKMSGLNLTHQSSGQHRGATRISKRGRPGARLALYQAAQVVVANDPAWRAWYDALRHRTDNPLAPKGALVAVAAKLLRVAWACVRHGTDYEVTRVFSIAGTVAA